MGQKFSLPRGTADILPKDVVAWQHLETSAKKFFSLYNYNEIRTPNFEEVELFARSMGQTSDVVQKQILSLASQKDSQTVLSGLALRPEGTASVVRSYIQNGLDRIEPLSKMFYIGPMFRGERPQKGRLRQFHQLGIEAIGPDSASPYLDAEVIALSVNFLKSLGLTGFKLKINTLGSHEDKENFSKQLRADLKPHLTELSEESQARFERNVFRILDSKSRADQEIVKSLKLDHSYLSDESLDYYAKVKDALRALGIEFEESIDLVRGLDYYTHTVFEISDSSLGSQDALGAGGRYNTLIEQLGGGKNIDAIGFALGMERLMLAGADLCAKAEVLKVYILALDVVAQPQAFALLDDLRKAGIRTDMCFKQSSAKSQMRMADKSGAQYVVILGEEEIKNKEVALKNMDSGDQENVKIEELINKFK
ncbi:MAG: histidyl-tRNA synthetase [Candidatus Omnitrophota bacterium]|jgi:histidyl-tRNA synthetase